MNYYQQPFTMPYPQGVYQQPLYPQFVYADQLVNPNDPTNQLPQQQQSYIENILRLNYGKGSKVFKGIVQAAGTDHIILKDVASETRYILLTIYLCYITFDEKIEYDYPYRNKQ